MSVMVVENSVSHLFIVVLHATCSFMGVVDTKDVPPSFF